jgi:predicted lipoprotein with Yx(FWY)xxD motif
MPLYTWIKDTKPGDASGNGMGQGAWKIAAP